jgi:hypothetical protein
MYAVADDKIAIARRVASLGWICCSDSAWTLFLRQDLRMSAGCGRLKGSCGDVVNTARAHMLSDAVENGMHVQAQKANLWVPNQNPGRECKR